MQLRPSELEAVAAGLGQFDASRTIDPISLAEAVRALPVNDCAPAWELAVRHFGRRTELDRAAGEIGMDVVHARDLLEAFSHQLAATLSAGPDQTPSQTL